MIATWKIDVTARGMHHDMLIGENVNVWKSESVMMHHDMMMGENVKKILY